MFSRDCTAAILRAVVQVESSIANGVLCVVLLYVCARLVRHLSNPAAVGLLTACTVSFWRESWSKASWQVDADQSAQMLQSIAV